MKVYVDELPKNCVYCPCYDCELGLCNISNVDLSIDESFNRYKQIHKDCPLQTISDHNKQVRKQVCDEIRTKAEDKYFEINDNGEVPIAWVVSEDILDQIEKGE